MAEQKYTVVQREWFAPYWSKCLPTWETVAEIASGLSKAEAFALASRLNAALRKEERQRTKYIVRVY